VSIGTPGGRLVVFPAVTALLATALLLAWSLRPTGPLTTEVIQDGLEDPWDLALTDDGRMLVTERIGRVRVFASADRGAPLVHTATLPDVRAELESGLLGIAVHEDDVFVCATRGADGEDPAGWRVDLLRATLAANGSLSAFEPLAIGPAQGAPRHQGCALEIGPDEHLWLTIGDANLPGTENRAQDPASLNGKVIRLGRRPRGDDTEGGGSPALLGRHGRNSVDGGSPARRAVRAPARRGPRAGRRALPLDGEWDG
jgi:glucose/arabinose dehydrogenase